MKITLKNYHIARQSSHLVVEEGIWDNKRYTQKHFSSQKGAENIYFNANFNAYGEWDNLQQVKKLALYKKRGIHDKFIFWTLLEKRVNSRPCAAYIE